MKTKIDRKKEIKRLKLDYRVNLAFDFLYLFEEHCPDFDKKWEVMKHVRAIEQLLQDKLFLSKDNFLDEVFDYELYLVCCNYKNRVGEEDE